MKTTSSRPRNVAPTAVPAKPPRAQKPRVRTPRAASPAPPVPRPVTTVALTGGQAWKMNGRYGVAYVRDAALAGELLAVEPKRLAGAAMAVYYDKKGRAFAWQVRFDAARWDDVLRRLA